MQRKTQEELQRIAVIHPNESPPAMTRAERLERWAELLSKEPSRRLSTLHRTEHCEPATRDRLRSFGSPISIAFEDPVLRALGLADDSYGEAKRFFELTDWELHDIVCYCHHSETMTAETAAQRVRWAAKRSGFAGAIGRIAGAFVR
jgi:hypothetical protein